MEYIYEISNEPFCSQREIDEDYAEQARLNKLRKPTFKENVYYAAQNLATTMTKPKPVASKLTSMPQVSGGTISQKKKPMAKSLSA